MASPPQPGHEPPATLQAAAAQALEADDPATKCAFVAALGRALDSGCLAPEPGFPGIDVAAPGIPERPVLVDPREVPKRRLSTREGHAALIHAVCHIEFSAINLALDAVCRFAGMPSAYYTDWAAVAVEEAGHFAMLVAHLDTLGYAYGDFEAHGGLWDTAARTAHDPLARMALVPRVMEARGLDVTPAMVERLEQAGDAAGARILAQILADEVGHVAVGSRWFAFLCDERGLDAESTFLALIDAEIGTLRGGRCNRVARLAAGFSERELDALFPP